MHTCERNWRVVIRSTNGAEGRYYGEGQEKRQDCRFQGMRALSKVGRVLIFGWSGRAARGLLWV